MSFGLLAADSDRVVVEPPPQPWRWRERASMWLDFPLGRLLDYGCGQCQLLLGLADRATERHGVDVDPDAFRVVQETHPELRLSTIGCDGKTAYPDDTFDTISIVEVIEHVPDERATLAELARILRPGGKLLLTTPHRGLLTFLDLGNFKFVFPSLHRFIHRVVMRNPAYYERRFEQARRRGMIGDISVAEGRRTWHRHYRPGQIEGFCPPSLQLVRHACYFPGMRLMMLLRAMSRVLCLGRWEPFPFPLRGLERWLSRIESPAGDQLVMMFESEPGHNGKRKTQDVYQDPLEHDAFVRRLFKAAGRSSPIELPKDVR